jgi:hypothetical protein
MESGRLKTPFAKGKVNGCGGAARKAEAAKGSTCTEIGVAVRTLVDA